MEGGIEILTNSNSYTSVNVVVAIGYVQPFLIEGLETFLIPHKKSEPAKDRVQLENFDHVVTPDLYVAGSLAGHRSQYAIACGSGVAVATDILTLWNNGKHTKVHDKLK